MANSAELIRALTEARPVVADLLLLSAHPPLQKLLDAIDAALAGEEFRPPMLQDESRELSRALSEAPGARQHAAQAAAAMREQEGMPAVFVFGSNLAGRHGRGAALFAWKKRGAVYGKGIGHHGNSYAIPTKDENLNTLALPLIELHVRKFLQYAGEHQELEFEVTPIGTGLAGYRHEDIAPMFKGAPPNCRLPDEWKDLT